MASKNLNLDQLDSAALFKLAQEKEKAEQEAQREENRVRIDEIRSVRKELIARHKRDLMALDRELEQLMGRVSSTTRRPVKTRHARTGTSISDILVSTIGSKDSMGIEEIRERAVEQGLKLSTVTQMLAYLKRTGRLESLKRGQYCVAA